MLIVETVYFLFHMTVLLVEDAVAPVLFLKPPCDKCSMLFCPASEDSAGDSIIYIEPHETGTEATTDFHGCDGLNTDCP
jgi:hypothetical protein